MTPDTATLVATVTAVIAALSAVSATAVAIYQAKLAQRSANLTGLLPLYERYQSDYYRGTRAKLYNGKYDLDALAPAQEHELRDLLNMLEFLRALLRNRILGFKTASAIFYHSPVDVWWHLRPFIVR